MYRPKMGFSVPLPRWFRGPLKQRVRERVLGETLAVDRHLRSHAICSTWSTQHQAGRRDYSSPLWTVLMFDAFLRNVTSGEQRPELREAG